MKRKFIAIINLIFSDKWFLYFDGDFNHSSSMTYGDSTKVLDVIYDIRERVEEEFQQDINVEETNNILKNSK